MQTHLVSESNERMKRTSKMSDMCQEQINSDEKEKNGNP